MAGAIGLQAQEHVERPDSLVRKPEPRENPFPMLGYYGYSSIGRYFFLPLDPGEFETKEDRAARINAETYRRVMESVNYNPSYPGTEHRPVCGPALPFLSRQTSGRNSPRYELRAVFLYLHSRLGTT